MQEAFGGIMNIIFIAVFLILIEGIFGFIVVYTKAFRVKNMVIASIEQYEGVRGCGLDQGETSKGTACNKKIIESAESVGYSGNSNLTCPTGYYAHSSGIFCWKRIHEKNSDKRVYNILVKLDIPLPIINRLGFDIFQVSGDTRGIETDY